MLLSAFSKTRRMLVYTFSLGNLSTLTKADGQGAPSGGPSPPRWPAPWPGSGSGARRAAPATRLPEAHVACARVDRGARGGSAAASLGRRRLAAQCSAVKPSASEAARCEARFGVGKHA